MANSRVSFTLMAVKSGEVRIHMSYSCTEACHTVAIISFDLLLNATFSMLLELLTVCNLAMLVTISTNQQCQTLKTAADVRALLFQYITNSAFP